MRWAFLLFSVTGFAAAGMSFHAHAKAADAPDPSPIFKAHCVSCHSGASPAAGLDLSQPNDKLASLYILAKGNAKDSLIMRRVSPGAQRPMPPNGQPLSDSELATLSSWINSLVPDPTPIFQAKCVRCHSGANPAARLDLSQTPMALSASGVIVRGDPAMSTLYKRITASSGQMPPGGHLSDSEVATIQGWITSLGDPTTVLYAKCMPCHRGANARAGLNLAAPLSEVADSKAIVKGDPDNSQLIKVVSGKAEPIMPPRSKGLSDPEIGILAHWIQGLKAQQ